MAKNLTEASSNAPTAAGATQKNYKGCVARQSYIEVQNRFNRKPRKPQRAELPEYDYSNFPALGNSTANRQQVPVWDNYRQSGQHANVNTNDNFSQQMKMMAEMMKAMNVMLSKLTSLIEVLTQPKGNNAGVPTK